jgi:hypothetical protein
MNSLSLLSRSAIAAIALFLFAIVACSSDSPESVLKRYFELVETNKQDEANELLSAEDKSVIALPDYQETVEGDFSISSILERAEEESKAFYDFLLENIISHEIVSSSENGDVTTFEVNVRYLNIFVLAFELAEEEPKLNEESLEKEAKNEAYKNAIKTLYGEVGPPFETATEEFLVIKEGDDWLVVANVQKAYNEAKANQLMSEAWEADFDGNYGKALRLYEEVRELTPDNVEVLGKIEAVERKIDEINAMLQFEPDAYAEKYLELVDVKFVGEAHRTDITFSVTNTGNKTIIGLKLLVVYRNPDGEVLNAEYIDIRPWGSGVLPDSTLENQESFLMATPRNWDKENFDVFIVESQEY